MQIEGAYDNIGCTVEEALMFLERFRIGLQVFDTYNNVVEEFAPRNRNNRLTLKPVVSS